MRRIEVFDRDKEEVIVLLKSDLRRRRFVCYKGQLEVVETDQSNGRAPGRRRCPLDVAGDRSYARVTDIEMKKKIDEYLKMIK